MSTRCEVTVIGRYGKVKLYHHHDGYPEGVGFDLIERMSKYVSEIDFDRFVNDLVKDPNDEYEITQYNHADREYEYFVDLKKKQIQCYSVQVNWDTDKYIEKILVNLKEIWDKSNDK
jgi:hypothetical protein